MGEYHPELRSVPCRFLTFAGWLRGTLHVPPKVALVDFLNRGEVLFRLTDVTLPETQGVHPFFALERGAVLTVLAEDPLEPAPSAPVGALREHPTSWLLPGGVVVQGTLGLLHGVRVSDHLMHRSGFVVLREATIFERRPDGTMTLWPAVPWLALQASRAIGASEVG